MRTHFAAVSRVLGTEMREAASRLGRILKQLSKMATFSSCRDNFQRLLCLSIPSLGRYNFCEMYY